MKRFAVFAIALAAAACAGGQSENVDTAAPAAGAVEAAPPAAATDSAMRADSARADSIRRDSAAKAGAKRP
jgi:hypothetical protein